MIGVTELGRRRRRRLRRSYLEAVCCFLCTNIAKLVALGFCDLSKSVFALFIFYYFCPIDVIYEPVSQLVLRT